MSALVCMKKKSITKDEKYKTWDVISISYIYEVKIMSRVIVNSFITFLIFSGAALGQNALSEYSASPEPEIDFATISSSIEQRMADWEVPGVVVGIVVGDDLVHLESFGVSNAETGTPLHPDALFDIASVSKLFTASLLMNMEQGGMADRYDRIEDVIDPTGELDLELGDIRLIDLTSHHSGLPAEPFNRRDLEQSPTVMLPYSRDELFVALREGPRLWKPRLEMTYSSFAVDLLGHALEVSAGHDLETLMDSRIWEPLGMEDTFVSNAPTTSPQITSHHWPLYSPRQASPRTESGEVWGGRGITSNVPDLARFASLQFRAYSQTLEVIDGARIAEMHRPISMRSSDWDVEAGAYGIGWLVRPYGEESYLLVEHDGNDDGHSAYIGAFPELGVGVVVLANLGGVADDIAEELLPGIIAPFSEIRSQFTAAVADGDWDRVQSLSGRMLSWNQYNRTANYWFGRSAIELGRCDEGVEYLSRAASAARFPDYAAFYLSVCASRDGDLVAATEQMNRAFDLGFFEGERLNQYPELEILVGTRGYDLIKERYDH